MQSITDRSAIRVRVAGWVCFLGYAWIQAAVPPESVTISTLYSQEINLDNGIHPRYTPLQHYRGKTFLVMPDADLRPLVTEIDDTTGKTLTVPLDPNPDYKAFPDGHQRFTLGIDPDGYLHIAGDMHGYTDGWTRYVERYNGQNMLYWRSNKALDVTGGFTFSGGEFSASRLPGIEWGGDSRFFNDKNGVLYYGSRVRAFSDSKLEGGEPFIAYGVYRYDHTTGLWTALGATPEKGEPHAKNYQTVLYWEWTMGFEAYNSNPRFDSQNRLHFSILGNTAHTEGSGLIYAMSDDLGKTWKKANGAVIPGLPLRGKDGDPDQGDLIVRSKRLSGGTEVFIDKEGRIALNVQGQWVTWAEGKWTPFSGGVGHLGPDGMLTGDGGWALTRSAGIGHPVKTFETGFGSCLSVSELALQNTGAIYALAPPVGNNYTNAKKIWVIKAVFGPTENMCTGGTPSASSGSGQAPQAFDGKLDTCWVANSETSGRLEYALASGMKKAVCRYELTSTIDSPNCDPQEWDLEGSADGSKWITLDTRKNQRFESRNQTKSYPVDNGTAYAFYRLTVKRVYGKSSDGIRLAELRLLTVDTSSVPSTPTIFFAHGDNGKAWLSWTQPERAANYTVKRSYSGGEVVVIAKNLTDPADFLDTTCANGKAYTYTVSASNAAGEGPDSAPVTVTPHPMAPRPPLLQTAMGRSQRIVLNWLPLWPDAVSYTVKRSGTSGGPYSVIARGVPGLTYTDIGLTNDRPYYYVVSASDKASGESPDSREICGSPFQWVRILRYKSVDWEDKGTASASAENPPKEVAANAFNGELNKWLFFKNSAWLQYNFAEGTAWAVTRYQIIPCGDAPERDPRNWQFQGSSDGKNWVTLDERKDQTFDEQRRRGLRKPRLRPLPRQISNEPNAYSFENKKTYAYYRLNITQTHSAGIGALSGLVLWADDVVLK